MVNGQYANCPRCGRKVAMLFPGSKVMMHCCKCRAELFAVCMVDGDVIVDLMPRE